MSKSSTSLLEEFVKGLRKDTITCGDPKVLTNLDEVNYEALSSGVCDGKDAYVKKERRHYLFVLRSLLELGGQQLGIWMDNLKPDSAALKMFDLEEYRSWWKNFQYSRGTERYSYELAEQFQFQPLVAEAQVLSIDSPFSMNKFIAILESDLRYYNDTGFYTKAAESDLYEHVSAFDTKNKVLYFDFDPPNRAPYLETLQSIYQIGGLEGLILCTSAIEPKPLTT